MLMDLLEYWYQRPIPWEEVKYTDVTKGLHSVATVLGFIFRRLAEPEKEKWKEQYDKLFNFVVATAPDLDQNI